jgi:tetratricopeptide (TPR) repeat protein
VVSELFEKVERPALPNTEARPAANFAGLGKRVELPLPRAEAHPAPNATAPDEASSKQSSSKVEVQPAPPNAMAQKRASSERITSETEDLPSPTAPTLSPSNIVAQEKASSEQLTRPVEEPIAIRPPAVPPTAGGHGLAPKKAAAYIALAHARIQQGDIAAARRLLERAADSDEAEASLLLAETYDPKMLARWGVLGIMPDLEKAKTLYREAERRGIRPQNDRVAVEHSLKRPPAFP